MRILIKNKMIEIDQLSFDYRTDVREGCGTILQQIKEKSLIKSVLAEKVVKEMLQTYKEYVPVTIGKIKL